MAQLDIIIGVHAVTAILQRQPQNIVRLLHMTGKSMQRLESVLDSAHELGIDCQPTDKDTLERLAKGGKHQGIIAECRPGASYQEKDLPDLLAQHTSPLLLVLDGITDPHNLGACLRTADAAGVCAVIVPKDKSASINSTVRKVACGAAETTPLITVTNLARCLKSLQEQGVWLVGTSDKSSGSIYQQDLTGPTALVMGAEGKGLRRLTMEACDFLVHIPMAGYVSSLNVSVATGVCLFEAVRQRQ